MSSLKTVVGIIKNIPKTALNQTWDFLLGPGIVVAAEEPATEEKRVNLVIESAKAKAQLKDLEDKILQLLSSSTGNILDDEELIETLSSSKIMGTKIEEQVKQQEITAVQIAEVRQVYKCLHRSQHQLTTGAVNSSEIQGTMLSGALRCTSSSATFASLIPCTSATVANVLPPPAWLMHPAQI